MRKIYDFSSNRELAVYFSISDTTISNWKTRNSVPLEFLLRASNEKDVSLDWLIYGKEKTQALKATEKMLLTAFNELDDKQQLQAVVFVGNLAQGGTSSPTASVSQHAGENAYNVGGDFNFNQK
ncbi:helix-turn-helix domain-containing protein [Haemophilus parahaemolyticus]|uniref:helix-turn-helix domain-containing protein n=1 Tax=Haemophilus parahaemolyticus TaxID=735 RepID=UPI0028E781D7|nr:helix-turn-helix domain-containing protein [Haemophilus parahaemolyticus]